MEIESLVDYARRAATPYVQHTLNKLRQQFSCGEDWRLNRHRVVTSESWLLKAAPLPVDACPNGEPIQVNPEAKVTFGEYTYKIYGIDYEPQRGRWQGLVSLTLSVGVQLGIPNAYRSFLQEIGRNGLLCVAREFTLCDGTSFYQVCTNSGALWLRSVAVDNRLRLEQLLRQLPRRSRQRVVHVAEVAHSATEADRFSIPGPWSGYKTHDTSNREWLIEKSSLDVGVAVEAFGNDNAQLQSKTAAVLRPPYEVVWQPDQLKDEGVSFLLVLS